MMIFNHGRLTRDQLLEAIQFALNKVPRKKLTGCPHGFVDTYDLARYVDYEVAHGMADRLAAWEQAKGSKE